MPSIYAADAIDDKSPNRSDDELEDPSIGQFSIAIAKTTDDEHIEEYSDDVADGNANECVDRAVAQSYLPPDLPSSLAVQNTYHHKRR